MNNIEPYIKDMRYRGKTAACPIIYAYYDALTRSCQAFYDPEYTTPVPFKDFCPLFANNVIVMSPDYGPVRSNAIRYGQHGYGQGGSIALYIIQADTSKPILCTEEKTPDEVYEYVYDYFGVRRPE